MTDREILKAKSERFSMSASIVAKMICIRCAGQLEWNPIPDFHEGSQAFFHTYGERGGTVTRCDATTIYLYVQKNWKA